MNDTEILEIKRRAEGALLALPGVHAVGLGCKMTQAEPTGVLAIRVYVLKKRSPAELTDAERIPPMIEGVPTDVVESSMPTISALFGAEPTAQLDDTARKRPLIGGTQITRKDGPLLGTLGCFFTIQGDAHRVLAVTNHHVFYRNATDVPNHELVGQPTDSESCTKCCSDIIGTVYDGQCDNEVDIVLVELKAGEKWLREVLDIGAVEGSDTVTPTVAQSLTYQVKKRGRTTQLTGGFIFDADMSGTIRRIDGSIHRQFRGALGVKGNPDPANPGTRLFTKAGDSGSAVFNLDNKVIGIEFGGAATSAEGPHSLVMPLQTIIDKFSTQVAPERRITLVLSTTTVTGQVQTVTASANAQPRPMAEPAMDVANVASRLAANEDERPVLHGARLQLDLSQSRLGRLWLDLYMQHSDEVRRLLDTQRRFATVWHRSGGAGLFQAMVRAFHDPQSRIPAEINGRSVSHCIELIAGALTQYGSADIKRDLPKLLYCVPDVAGLSYQEVLDQLKSLDAVFTSQTA